LERAGRPFFSSFAGYLCTMVDSVIVDNVITPLLTMLDSPDDGVVNAYCSLLIETMSSVASLMMSNEVMVSFYGRFLLEQQI
jgi:hypothetical protein